MPLKNKTNGAIMKRRSSRTSGSTKMLTRAALIAALYVVMSYISTLVGLSSGAVQFRLSEILCVLPLLFPEAVVGLFIGCIISNILAGCVIWDIILGSLATLIGALGCFALRRLPLGLKWLATLPNFAANTFFVPIILMFAYGVNTGYPLLVLTVGIGEAVMGIAMGSALYYSIRKVKLK